MKLSRRALIHNYTSCVLGARTSRGNIAELRKQVAYQGAAGRPERRNRFPLLPFCPSDDGDRYDRRDPGSENCIRNASKNDLFRKRVERRFLSRTPRDATNGHNNCSKLKPHPLRVSVPRWRCSSQITFLCHISFFVFPAASFTSRCVTVDVVDSSSSPPSSWCFCTTRHRCR